MTMTTKPGRPIVSKVVNNDMPAIRSDRVRREIADEITAHQLLVAQVSLSNDLFADLVFALGSMVQSPAA